MSGEARFRTAYDRLVMAGEAPFVPDGNPTSAEVTRQAGNGRTCRKCGCPIVHMQGSVWVVTGTDSTADGLTYCPPNPDHDGRFGEHRPKAVK